MEQKGGGLVFFVVEIAFLVLVILVTILAGAGNPKDSGSICQANCREQTIRRCPAVYSFESQCSRCHADHFCPGHHVPAADHGRFCQLGSLSAALHRVFTDFNSFAYNFTFFILIILFTYFYTAITVNPNQMAEDMKKNGGFIPGVKPGKKTAEFIDNVMSRITLPGSIFLGFVAIMPAIVRLVGVNSQFAQFYGGTSLLILVGVVLDTLQQIESHLADAALRRTDKIRKDQRTFIVQYDQHNEDYNEFE